MNTRDTADILRRILGLAFGEKHLATLARGLVDRKGNLAAFLNLRNRLEFRPGFGLSGKGIKEDFIGTDTADQVSVILPSGAAASGATGVSHLLYAPSNIFIAHPLGAGQTLLPSIVATGLDIGGDQTSTEGWELISHYLGATGRPFVVGNDPAFYMRVKLLIADASGCNPLLIGFRRAAVVQGTYTSILDYAALGCNTSADPMAIKQLTGLNGTDVATDTTQTLADARAYTVELRVSAAGVLTFLHDAATPGVLAAPTAGAAFTFDDGDPVIPFVFFLNSADLANSVVIETFEAGLDFADRV